MHQGGDSMQTSTGCPCFAAACCACFAAAGIVRKNLQRKFWPYARFRKFWPCARAVPTDRKSPDQSDANGESPDQSDSSGGGPTEKFLGHMHRKFWPCAREISRASENSQKNLGSKLPSYTTSCLPTIWILNL